MDKLVNKIKLILVILVVLLLIGCSGTIEANNITMEKEPKFGGVFIQFSIDEFNDLGFEYGDSINFKFSNGYELNDIGYFDGFYVKNDTILLCAYPGYKYVYLVNYNGEELADMIHYDDSVTVNIRLNEKGKYLKTQQALKMTYTSNRNDYSSDIVFANFRCIEGGNIKPNLFYRSASPCDNQYNRATYTDKLIKEANVQTIIDMSDSKDDIDKYYNDSSLDCPYWKQLYENDRVFPFSFSSNYYSDTFKAKVKQAMEVIINNNGPYLIHCLEGKDRTGFLCALVESLSGFTRQELEDDYMVTYDNYYGYNKTSNKDKYDTIIEAKFMDIYDCITNNSDSILDGAKSYLSGCGMNNEEIDTLISKITK